MMVHGVIHAAGGDGAKRSHHRRRALVDHRLRSTAALVSYERGGCFRSFRCRERR